MKTSWVWSRWLSGTLCLCGTLASAEETPPPVAEVQPPPQVQVIEVQNETTELRTSPTQGTLVVDPNRVPGVNQVFLSADPNQAGVNSFRRFVVLTDDTALEPGKYWIGLLCVDAGEALRDQLGLEPDVGLLVEAVTDEAPAKKAGVQKNDVLLSLLVVSDDPKAEPKAEPKPLKQVTELVEAVQKSEAKPLRLTLVRRGQKQTIEVTPAERPQAQTTPTRVTVQLKQAENQLQQLLQAQRNQAEAQANQATKEADRAREAVKVLDQKLKEQHLGLRLAGPMFVVPTEGPKLPEGVSMEFRQVVGQPEQIIVQKGDQKWQLTAEQLDKLPEDLRLIAAQQMAARRGAVMPPVPHSGTIAWRSATLGDPLAGNPLTMPPTGYGKGAVSGVSTVTRLPEEVSITISRNGSAPAQITVKNKEQIWEITEKELDKLPADIRKHVESMLSPRNSTAPSGKIFTARIANPYDGYGRPGSPDPAHQLQERQDAMLKQLQQLTEKVEKLQQALEKSASKQ